MADDPRAPAGWYEDPSRPGTQRYWDGTSWLAPPGVYADPDDPGTRV